MAFKVTARTLLQLGAELISSDAVAFYELIKNAFDAQSPTVEVRIVKRLSKANCAAFLNTLHHEDSIDIDLLKKQISQATIQDAYEVDRFRARVRVATTIDRLIQIVEQANYILFRDQGEGMSLVELNSVYLTIGTRSRQQQRLDNVVRSRPILGEKGIGRLSAMRLGDGLKVVTTKAGEAVNNELSIDWSIFSHNSDALLESIQVQPNLGQLKEDPSVSGTRIYIYKLHTDWVINTLQDIANEQLSKFIDPFQKLHRSFIKLWYNTVPVITPTLNKVLFDNAHAFVQGQFRLTEGNPVLSGSIDYKLYNKQKTFSLSGTHLTSVVQTDKSVLERLGSFSFQFYWFNNRIVKEIDGIGKIKQVRDLIKSWAGGMMVYRDGFRVFPYGSLDDDWLQLDPKALGSGGYKVNRRQLIGKVDISSEQNPALIDQTNREGLRDCPEKASLMRMLQHTLWSEFRTLLDKTEEERLTSAPLDLDELEARLERNEQKLFDNLDLLIAKFPGIEQEEQSIGAIREALALNKRLLNDVRTEKESVEQRMEVTLHLAGLGLMVDIIAHELNRSTEHTLSTLNTVQDEDLSEQTRALLKMLGTQLKTIKARLKILDPLGPSGRQTKETFNLHELIEETLVSHQAQFKRHSIHCLLEPDKSDWRLTAVKGMFVQILENLIANSVYWLKQEKITQPAHQSQIRIYLDKAAKCLYFTDNGPGIPTGKREEVFQPFVSTKPPGEGKGLGLYISREIAKYHGVTLSLSEDSDTNRGILHTFVLNLTSTK